MQTNSPTQAGFTLVELIVSLAVFATVVTMSVGALLILISTNQQLQAEQSVMTNLSFALDSMSREMRTGTHFYCAARPNYSAGGDEGIFRDDTDHEARSFDTNDCPTGKSGGDNLQGVSFVEGGDSVTGAASNRILYFFDSTGGSDSGKLLRRVGNDPAQPVTSSGIEILDAEFFVTGSAPLSDSNSETDQASITIYIEAKDVTDPTDRVYTLQTTVTQRALDI